MRKLKTHTLSPRRSRDSRKWEARRQILERETSFWFILLAPWMPVRKEEGKWEKKQAFSVSRFLKGLHVAHVTEYFLLAWQLFLLGVRDWVLLAQVKVWDSSWSFEVIQLQHIALEGVGKVWASLAEALKVLFFLFFSIWLLVKWLCGWYWVGPTIEFSLPAIWLIIKSIFSLFMDFGEWKVE